MSRRTNLFNSVPVQKVSRNFFDLSHEVKMSGKFGYLYPVLLLDALPGDTIRDQMTAFIRFAPMLAPVMHRIDVTTHFFFVPNRLLTDHWEEFITGGQDGLAEVVLPYCQMSVLQINGGQNALTQGSLGDYLGLPTISGSGTTEQISMLPFRAYQKIWNDWYMDPTLDEEADLDLELQGECSVASLTHNMFDLRQSGWEKDYFTSCLPWAQRGAQVLMPLAGTASAGDVTYLPHSRVKDVDGTNVDEEVWLSANPANIPADQLSGIETASGDPYGPLRIENIDEITFSGSSVTINDFRMSLAIQRWLENNARGGPRYIEQLEAHFNTRVPDYRLQRSEYLGGGKQPVRISEVLATANTEVSENEIPVGDMAGHGISVGKSNRFSYRCQEHGMVIGILHIKPRTAYSQGLPRLWSRKSKYDFAWPELAHLGEQAILNKEVFFSSLAADDDENQEVFGYLPRYAEYKFMNDRIAGEFKSTLEFWHLGRKFLARPSLTSNFTTFKEAGDATYDDFRRIFAVQNGSDYLWMQLFHRLSAQRPLPYFGVPRLLG